MIQFNSECFGTMVVKQGENEFTIQLRRGNCLAVFIYERPDGFCMLFNFFADVQHLKNIVKGCPNIFDEVQSVRLNMWYKESATILPYMVKLLKGRDVVCNYEPKNI